MIFAQGLQDQDTISRDISDEEKDYKVLALGACRLQGTKQTLIQAMASAHLLACSKHQSRTGRLQDMSDNYRDDNILDDCARKTICKSGNAKVLTNARRICRSCLLLCSAL